MLHEARPGIWCVTAFTALNAMRVLIVVAWFVAFGLGSSARAVEAVSCALAHATLVCIRSRNTLCSRLCELLQFV
jgi:hypothetical protein